jgi:NAD(P)-dependent dehydrogenase (short-subunit alcohol dehydrogenase family)
MRGKRVLVTAAGAGIGRAIAQAFLDNGARVHVCDVAADRLAELKAAAPSVGVTETDVADPSQVDRLFDEAMSALGGLDVLVNNAGISGPTGPVETVSPSDWARTIEVNLNSQFYCARRAVPALKQAGGGAIVNLSSTAGLLGCPLRSPYVASKWAVIGFTKTLAMELGPYGIRVNAICPGSVEGERIERVIAAEAKSRGVSAEAVRESYLEQTSMRTFVTQDDVVNLVLFVCSDKGSKISGQALAVDGHTEHLAC